MPRPGALGGPGLPGRVRIADATLTTRSVVEQDRFGHFISEIQRSGDRLMEQLGQKMEDKAKRYAPVRTGRLRNSIHYSMTNHGREVYLTSNVPYAGVMESGSRPHQIHGVRANFDWKGGRFVWNDPHFGPVGSSDSGYQNWTWAHGATVRHPGTKPHRYMARAFHETWQEARFVMRQVYPG